MWKWCRFFIFHRKRIQSNSKEAVNNINMNIVGGEGKILDMNEKFTLEDNSFSIIVADICLHFFNEEKTVRVMNEIKSEKEWNFNCKSFYLALMINITHLVLDMKLKKYIMIMEVMLKDILMKNFYLNFLV